MAEGPGVGGRRGVVFMDSASTTTIDRAREDDVDALVPDRVETRQLQPQPVSPVSSSGGDSEGSYADVYSDDGSYHSEGSEIAEMWDPYRKNNCVCIHLAE